MLPGTASDKIKEGIGNYTKIHEVFSMQEAVKKARELAEKEDVVMLSPAAASFNLFKNEFDRGDQFVKAVKNLSK
jgi:UDP-N-acetylmuramoylalanine--D-glutamate ligase